MTGLLEIILPHYMLHWQARFCVIFKCFWVFSAFVLVLAIHTRFPLSSKNSDTNCLHSDTQSSPLASIRRVSPVYQLHGRVFVVHECTINICSFNVWSGFDPSTWFYKKQCQIFCTLGFRSEYIHNIQERSIAVNYLVEIKF